MKSVPTGYLLLICGILALMHWGHMPLWGGAILFVCLQIFFGVISISSLLLTLVLAAQAEAEDAPTLHAVPDPDESA